MSRRKRLLRRSYSRSSSRRYCHQVSLTLISILLFFYFPQIARLISFVSPIHHRSYLIRNMQIEPSLDFRAGWKIGAGKKKKMWCSSGCGMKNSLFYFGPWRCFTFMEPWWLHCGLKERMFKLAFTLNPPNSENINSWHSWCMTARREMVEMAEGSVVKNRKIDLVWKERNAREKRPRKEKFRRSRSIHY